MTDVTDAAPGGDNGAMSTPNGRQVPDWVILSIACVAQFMVVLDVSIVNVALPSIGRDLHYSPTGLQWVVNAYVLTFAGFLLLGGRAADLFGRRRVYLFGLGLFTVASLVGGLAQNAAWLTDGPGRAGHRRAPSCRRRRSPSSSPPFRAYAWPRPSASGVPWPARAARPASSWAGCSRLSSPGAGSSSSTSPSASPPPWRPSSYLTEATRATP